MSGREASLAPGEAPPPQESDLTALAWAFVVAVVAWPLALDSLVWPVVAGYLAFRYPRQILRGLQQPATALFGLFIAISLVSALQAESGDRAITAARTGVIDLETLVFIAAIAGASFFNAKRVILAMVVLVAASAALAVTGLLVGDVSWPGLVNRFLPQSILDTGLGSSTFGWRALAERSSFFIWSFWRPHGAFEFATSYAVAMAVWVPLALSQFDRLGRVLRIAGLGVLLAVLGALLTTTRTPVAALTAAVFFVAVPPLLRRERHLRRLIFVAGALALILGLAAVSIPGGWLRSLLETRDPLTRLEIYRTTIEYWLQRPLFGWGTEVTYSVNAAVPPLGSHTEYLAVLFKTGIVGAIAFGAFVVALLRSTISHRNALLTIAVITSLMCGITEVLDLDPMTFAIIGVCWGLAARPRAAVARTEVEALAAPAAGEPDRVGV